MKQVNSSTRHLLHVRNVQGIDTRTKQDNYTVNSVKSTLKQRTRVPNRNQIVKVGLKKHSYRGSYMSVHVLLNLLNELGKRDKM